MELNKRCHTEFRISTWPRWDYDLDAATLTFSANGVPRVIASIVAVGTTSRKSNTWLWAWANEHIPEAASARLLELKAFGEAEQIEALTEDSLADDEYLGWAMTAVAAHVLGAKGAYRCPGDNGFLYVVYTDLSIVT